MPPDRRSVSAAALWFSAAVASAVWVWCWLSHPTLLRAAIATAPLFGLSVWTEYRWRRGQLLMTETGLTWGWRMRLLRWADVRSARLISDGVLLDTAGGELLVPAGIADSGRLVHEVRRRTTPTRAAPTGPTGTLLRGWLGLEPGHRRQVRTTTSRAEQRDSQLGATYSLVGVATMVLAVLADEAWFAGLCGLLVAGWVWRNVIFAKPPANLAWFDDDGMEFEDRRGQRIQLPWHQLIALRDQGDRFTLVTTAGDLTVLDDGEAAAAVKYTAQQVLAALAEQGGWTATAGDASISPAERMTGADDRGLSRVEPPLTE